MGSQQIRSFLGSVTKVRKGFMLAPEGFLKTPNMRLNLSVFLGIVGLMCTARVRFR